MITVTEILPRHLLTSPHVFPDPFTDVNLEETSLNTS